MPNMITLSNGNKISLETVDAAMEEYTKKHPEPEPEPEKYVFQAGDVVVNSFGRKRVIVKLREELVPINVETGNVYFAERGQSAFEKQKYRKIGVLSDYIK